ncbi:MAG TPA: hypothetical protein VEB19_00715 [Gemmatimonadaceae bacterium]|nr:hypothetical protein [Gemmatimonadaceae bacterium]
MHLLPCDRPEGLLESAPRTSLSGPATLAQWEGFWASDERYYARCTQVDGTAQWYRVDDVPAGRRRRETRVIPLRPRSGLADVDSRRLVVFGSRRGGRTILIGRSRRRRQRDAIAHDAGNR